MYRITLTPGDSGAADRLRAVYDPRDPALRIRSGLCTMEVNGAGGLDLVVDRSHPLYEELRVRSGWIDVTDDNGIIFRGRISSVTTDRSLAKTVHAEGLLAVLNDSALPPFQFPADFLNDPAYQAAAASGNVVRYYLQQLISRHNATVQPWQQLTVGEVTVRDLNNYITRGRENYSSTLDVLRETTFESSLGGYVRIRLGSGIDRRTYIDYLAELPVDDSQTVTFGRNLLDLLTADDAAELYTAVLPVGADGLTLTGLPDGNIGDGLYKSGATIYNGAAEAQFGTITRILAFDDVTLPANLLQRGRVAALAAGYARSVEVTALDLQTSGGTFRAGYRVPMDSGPYGIRLDLPLTQLTIDLLDPSATQITFGTPAATITDASAAALRARDLLA